MLPTLRKKAAWPIVSNAGFNVFQVFPVRFHKVEAYQHISTSGCWWPASQFLVHLRVVCMCLAVLMPAIAKSPKYAKYISSKTARLSLPYFASLDCLWHIRNQLGVFLSSQAASTKTHLELNIDVKKYLGGWIAIIGRNQHQQLIWILWLKNMPCAGPFSCFRWRYGAPSDAVPAGR